MLVTILGSGNQPGNLRTTITLIQGWTKTTAKKSMLPICAQEAYETPKTRSLMSLFTSNILRSKYCPSLTLLWLLLSLYPLLLIRLMKLDISSADADPKNDSTNENNQISLHSKARVYNKLHWQQENTNKKKPKKPNWPKQRLVTKT